MFFWDRRQSSDPPSPYQFHLNILNRFPKQIKVVDFRSQPHIASSRRTQSPGGLKHSSSKIPKSPSESQGSCDFSCRNQPIRPADSKKPWMPTWVVTWNRVRPRISRLGNSESVERAKQIQTHLGPNSNMFGLGYFRCSSKMNILAWILDSDTCQTQSKWKQL